MIIGIAGKAGSGKDLVGNIIQYLTACKKYEGMDCFNADYVNKGFALEADYTNISKWETKKFADPLKDIVCLLTGCTRADLEDREFKNNRKFRFENKWYGSVREFLQYFGTDLIRKNLGDDIWVNATFAEYKPLYTQYGNVDHYYNLGNCKYECRYKGDYFELTNGSVEKTKSEDELISLNATKVYYEHPNWIITDVRFPNEVQAIKDKGGITIRVNRNFTLNSDIHESETALDNGTFDYVLDNNGTIEELLDKVKEILIKEKII